MSCRILIVKLASLGDILATSPCFSALNNIDNTIDHLVDKESRYSRYNRYRYFLCWIVY